MMFYDWPYLYATGTFPRQRFNSAKPVRHQQTCPVCGRKLVNTYRKDGVWKCRRCWEADK